MSTVILLSDFLTPDCSKELSMVKKHHDVLAIRVSDPREEELLDVGLIELEDAESGEQILVDTSDPGIRLRYQEEIASYNREIFLMMRRYRIPFVNIRTGEFFYIEGAFNSGYDRLVFTADHELIHNRNFLLGKYKGVKVDSEVASKEEWSTYMKNYQR